MIRYLKSIIRRSIARKLQIPEIPIALERLAKNGFAPKTIFDVGAYQGDFAKLCLHIWPHAKISCFEVLEHKIVDLEALSAQHKSIEVFRMLLGADPRESVPLHKAETASSILEEHVSHNFPIQYYRMESIDNLIHKGVEPPELLKIDAQGYELEILKGGENSLHKIRALLLELNLLDIHKDVPLLGEIVEWLRQRKWVAYDICGLTRRPLDGALWQADFIFVPERSSLRTDRRWSR